MTTFIASIVNALPEAIVTAIITGIFVYLIQKRIESSYNVKLEQFKAELQSSTFEHQTKFVRNHQKEVETLETLYQKFMTFADGFAEGILGGLDYEIPSKKITKLEISNIGLERKHTDILHECMNYFDNNRLFLSDDISEKIGNNLNNANLYLFIITSICIGLKHDGIDADFIKSMNGIITNKSNLGISKLNVNKPNLRMLLHEMVQQISGYKFALEQLYKSVADIKSE